MPWLNESTQSIFFHWYDAILWRSQTYWQTEIYECSPELFEAGLA